MTAVAYYDAFREPKAAAHIVKPVHIATTPSVEASEFKFQPATVTVKAGESVTLTFKNAGTVEHNFSTGKKWHLPCQWRKRRGAGL